MSDVRKITVELKVNNGSSKASGEGGQVNIENAVAPVENDDSKALGKSVLVNQAYSRAKSLVLDNGDWAINRYFNLREDYLNENTYLALKTTVTKVASAASTIATGYAVGGVAGAVIAGVAWTGNEAFTQVKRYNTYFTAVNESNISLEFGRTRAGLVNNGRGTEN